MHLSLRCGAYARCTGEPCRNGAMANGRCRMHGGATPRGKLHGAFVRGDHTIETIADHRKSAALNETEEAETQQEAIKAKIAAALAMRREAAALKYAWIDRYHSGGTSA